MLVWQPLARHQTCGSRICASTELVAHTDQARQANDRVKEALAGGEPAISVDTKKKEAGWRLQERRARVAPQGSPEEVHAHLAGTAEARRRTQLADHRMPPAARHEQMGQDRALPVLVHHRQLARQAAPHSSGHRPTYRGNNDDDRPQSALRTRPKDDEIEAVNLTRHDFHGDGIIQSAQTGPSRSDSSRTTP